MPSPLVVNGQANVLKRRMDTGLKLAWDASYDTIDRFGAASAIGGESFEWGLEAAQAPGVAPGRGVNGDIGGPRAIIGGNEQFSSAQVERPRIGQCRYYSTLQEFGPIVAASRGAGANAYKDLTKGSAADAVRDLKVSLARDLPCDGTGTVAIIDSAQTSATQRARRSNGFDSAPGAMRMFRQQYVNIVNPVTGATRLDANGLGPGFQINSIDPTANAAFGNFVLDRSLTTVAGDLVVQGDDLDNSYNEAIQGLSYHLRTGDLWCEVDRTIATELTPATVDGANGDLTYTLLDQALIALLNRTGKVGDRVAIMNPYQFSNLHFGVTGVSTGLFAQVWLTTGDQKYSTRKPGLATPYGVIELEVDRRYPPHEVFIVDPSDIQWISWNQTAGKPEWLPGGGDGGIWTSVAGRDSSTATARWYGNLKIGNPPKHARITALRGTYN